VEDMFRDQPSAELVEGRSPGWTSEKDGLRSETSERRVETTAKATRDHDESVRRASSAGSVQHQSPIPLHAKLPATGRRIQRRRLPAQRQS
jgi:hypothetical protein